MALRFVGLIGTSWFAPAQPLTGRTVLEGLLGFLFPTCRGSTQRNGVGRGVRSAAQCNARGPTGW